MTDDELARKANLRHVKSAITFVSKSISSLGIVSTEARVCEDPLCDEIWSRAETEICRLRYVRDTLDEVRKSLEKENDLADEVVYGDVPLHSEWMDLDTPVKVEPERDEILDRFTFHPPKEGQEELYEAIRHIARDMAMCVRDLCPEGRERSLALTKLEESVFFANAAIARS